MKTVLLTLLVSTYANSALAQPSVEETESKCVSSITTTFRGQFPEKRESVFTRYETKHLYVDGPAYVEWLQFGNYSYGSRTKEYYFEGFANVTEDANNSTLESDTTYILADQTRVPMYKETWKVEYQDEKVKKEILVKFSTAFKTSEGKLRERITTKINDQLSTRETKFLDTDHLNSNIDEKVVESHEICRLKKVTIN